MQEKEIMQLPFWDALKEEEKTGLLKQVSMRSYQKGASLNAFHDICLGMIYVLKGSIRVYFTSMQGREITLFYLQKQDCCILSASCVIRDLQMDIQLTAEADTQVAAIHAGFFQSLMEKNMHVRCFAYELSTKRLSTVVQVMEQILFARFDQRLASCLLDHYKHTNRTVIKKTQEEIAREVNSAREVVTRMLRSFAQKGWIEIHRGEIVLKDLTALKNMAKPF